EHAELSDFFAVVGAADGVHQRAVQLVDRHVTAERAGIADVAAVLARLGAVADADGLAFDVHRYALLEVTARAAGDHDRQVVEVVGRAVRQLGQPHAGGVVEQLAPALGDAVEHADQLGVLTG